MRVSFSQGIEFEPDQGWDYSNINFVLVGLAIERATGQPFAELLEQRILRPLGSPTPVIRPRRTCHRDRARGSATTGSTSLASIRWPRGKPGGWCRTCAI